MRISGFSFAKNAVKLYFPLKQAIESILPIVDEFVVAIGDNDPDDTTRKEVESIRSSKIKIVDTVWDIEKYPRGTENAHQTDIAKSHCTGDWLFYVQADEVIHEKYLPTIRQRCEDLLDDQEVEGLLFDYKHFWGDYDHYHLSHGWYKQEIRIIRNDLDIHSWESAQSFRRIPGFDGRDYRQQEGTYKLKVARAHADVYHYGWVRPPRTMEKKTKALATIHKGKEVADALFAERAPVFDYGDMSKIPRFEGTHPQVMQAFIQRFDWENQLRVGGSLPDTRPLFKHEKWKYKALTWIEQNLAGGREIGGFHNYVLLDR